MSVVTNYLKLLMKLCISRFHRRTQWRANW